MNVSFDCSDVNRVTFSALPRDCGVGEGSWAGLCFSPSQWSMVFSSLPVN